MGSDICHHELRVLIMDLLCVSWILWTKHKALMKLGFFYCVR